MRIVGNRSKTETSAQNLPQTPAAPEEYWNRALILFLVLGDHFGQGGFKSFGQEGPAWGYPRPAPIALWPATFARVAFGKPTATVSLTKNGRER